MVDPSDIHASARESGDHAVGRAWPATVWTFISCAATFCVIAFCAPAAHAQQGIETGDTEFRVWAGGGHATNGVTRNDTVWNIGVRYGWVITKPMLPGPLRGR